MGKSVSARITVREIIWFNKLRIILHLLIQANVNAFNYTLTFFIQALWNTFLGDCAIVDEWLLDKPVLSRWSILHYLNIFFRCIAQVCILFCFIILRYHIIARKVYFEVIFFANKQKYQISCQNVTQICFQCFKPCQIIGELFYTNITKDNPLTRQHACSIISLKHPFTTTIFLSQTCFVNNPISGAVILVAFFIADWEVGIGTILGGSAATIIEMVRVQFESIRKIFMSMTISN